MKKLSLLICCFIAVAVRLSAQDPLLNVLKDELSVEMKQLQKQDVPPYYMDCRAVDERNITVNTTFGSLIRSSDTRSVLFVPQIRVGTPQQDNFKDTDVGSSYTIQGPVCGVLPVDGRFREEAFREGIWSEVKARYEYVKGVYQKMIDNQDIKVESSDKSPCFSDVPVEKYYEAPLSPEKVTIDCSKWEEGLKKISRIFKKYPEILQGDASMSFRVVRTYFVNTEGSEVVHNLTYANLIVAGMVRAEDGMELPLHLTYFAYHPDDLPVIDSVCRKVEVMVEKLMALREAPVVDAYRGPILMSGAAAGVFFHEIFGHRVEGQRMRRDSDGQTFKKMVGQYVLPASMQVYDDPTLRKYGKQDLNGYYKYDEQGVRAERVNIVIDGKIHDFLMTRKPMENYPRSNGHARATWAFDPVSRQSNLVIETKDHKSEAELRKAFINELKAQGKTYGYYLEEVTGGFTQTNKLQINSFNVTPLEVYKVFADGRPDQLVRGVNLIGTPLAMFSNIICAGGASEVFTGMCGAESGSIPVTAIAPALLVKGVELQRKAKSQAEHQILKRP